MDLWSFHWAPIFCPLFPNLNEELLQLVSVETKLQGISMQVKGLSKEEYSTRADLAVALPERIRAISDGIIGGNQENVWNGNSTARSEIKFNMSGSFCNYH